MEHRSPNGARWRTGAALWSTGPPTGRANPDGVCAHHELSAPRWGFLAWFVVGAPGLGALGYDSAARWASNKRHAFASSLASDLRLCTTTMAKSGGRRRFGQPWPRAEADV